MCSEKKKVLLLVGECSDTDNENQYKKHLLDTFECQILQVLHFDFINLNELQNLMQNPNSYHGLILTSPRAATAIFKTNIHNHSCIKEWAKKPTFCIGQSTELAAREKIGLINILGTNSGNAKNLANFIVNTLKEDMNQPLLFPCSNIARNTLPLILQENGIEMKKIVVYKTEAHDLLQQTLESSLNQSPDVLVFFSPSIADNVLLALNNNKIILKKFKIIAIGSVTEQSLLQIGIQVDGVAEKPDPSALTAIISKVV